MCHVAWGWESHVDAKRRLSRRAAFNGSMARFGLVVNVLGDLFVFVWIIILLLMFSWYVSGVVLILGCVFLWPH